MALTTYAELQTSIADLLDRDDLTDSVQDFITLAEAQMARDIRHWRMETRSTGQQSAGDRYMQLPTNWLETKRLGITGSGTSVLNLVSNDTMADMRAKNEDTSGTPTHYCLTDGQFELYPTPSGDTDLELVYIAKIPALSDDNTDNWVLDEAPDVYLYGAALHSAPFLQEDERVKMWAQMYGAGVERLNTSSDQAKWSGSGLRLKVRGLG